MKGCGPLTVQRRGVLVLRMEKETDTVKFVSCVLYDDVTMYERDTTRTADT